MKGKERRKQRTRAREREATLYVVRRTPWYLHLAAVALLLAVTFFLYRGALGLGFFNVDDPGYVTQNPWIKAVTAQNVRHILTQPYFANYSPTHLFSYMLDYRQAGPDPWAFHLSSIVWAGLAAGGVYLVGLVLLGRWWAAFAAALLFVLHPAHVEAVAWISSRKDLVAAAFTLPAMAAYFVYRRGGRAARRWYVLSLVLFTLGIAGKLSVVVAPVVLVAFDWFLEGRRDRGLLLDKGPFVIIAAFFGLRVILSQPATRNPFDVVVFGHSTLHSLWLLTGLGTCELNRGRPGDEAMFVLKILFAVAPVVLLLLPWVLRRRLAPLVPPLAYWILLALVPAQVLSFIHPVADRYLFFPSAGFVLLLAWVLHRTGSRRGPAGPWVAGAAAVFVALVWAHAAHGYLRQWSDPRSVWFAFAQRKGTTEPTVFQFLGGHYQDEADRVSTYPTREGETPEQAVLMAEAVWEGDQRLPELLGEWQEGVERGPVSQDYGMHLRAAAAEAYEKAVAVQGTRVMPNLHFRMGKLALDTGRLDDARTAFERTLDQAQRHTMQSVRDELGVRSTHALGLVAWRERDYDEAMRLIEEAMLEQQRLGGTWVPDIDRHLERARGLAGANEGP